MTTTTSARHVRIFLLISTISVFLVLLTAYTKYIYAKDYVFFVEAPCDTETEQCFVRSCDDYCPPNEFETYKTFAVPATLFAQCTDNTCQNICLNENMQTLCKQIVCDSDNGDDCSF